MQSATTSFAPGRGWDGAGDELDGPSTLLLAFGDPSIGEAPAPLRALRERFPRSVVLGCSTAGQIVEDAIVDGGVSALVMRFERSSLRCASAAVERAEDSRRVGGELGEALSGPDLRGVFVLSDGLGVNGTRLVEGMRERLPGGVCITGGLAGDGDRFERTWVCAGGDPGSGVVGAVGVYGAHASVRYGSRGGWFAFGPERTVTRSEGNVLYELDGHPALEVYERYLGEKAKDLPASALLFPLALRVGGARDTLVRTVLGVSREDQSMTFAGDVPEGAGAQLMRANIEALIDGAARASSAIDAHEVDGDAACVPISCVGRRMVLRHRAEDELEEVVSGLPWCGRHVGFYSYGEISPIGCEPCALHNQTMTLTIFSETVAEEGHAPHPRASAA